MGFSIDYHRDWLRQHNREAIARNLADREARALRLTPEAVARWTALVRAVAPAVARGKRVCNYGPWERALQEYSRVPPFVGQETPYSKVMLSEFHSFVADLAQPGWPRSDKFGPRADMVEFALCYLEADVMKFGSGYKKRHFIRRLQQSPLSDDQIARIDRLIRRAVTEGTGLEENRAYRKLAAHLIVQGHLPGLYLWLEQMAQGAQVRSKDAPARLIFQVLNRVGEATWTEWIRWQSSKALTYPTLTDLADADRANESLARRSAFRFLMAIEARSPSCAWPRISNMGE